MSVVAINVKHYGAQGDATTDDTARIQAAINACVNAVDALQERELFFPPGDYRIESSLTLTNARGLKIRGSGPYSTRILWYGSSGNPMWLWTNCADVTLQDLYLQGHSNALNRPSHGVRVYRDSGAGGAPGYEQGNCQFRNVVIGGDSNDVMMTTCVAIDGSASFNYRHSFDNVKFLNPVTYGIYAPNSTTERLSFQSCYFHNGVYGFYGRASATFRDCVFNSQSGANCAANDTSRAGHQFYGCSSSASSRWFYWDGGATGNPHPLVLKGCWFDATGLNADNRFVTYRAAGPLTIEDSVIGTQDGGNPPYVYLDTGGNRISVKMVNNKFDATGSDAVRPLQVVSGGTAGALAQVWVEKHGNTYRTSGSVGVYTIDSQRTITTNDAYGDGYDVQPEDNRVTLVVDVAAPITLNPHNGLPPGFRVTVKDGSYAAATNNITWTPYTVGAEQHYIDNAQTSAVLIDTDGGWSELVFDGSTWHRVANGIRKDVTIAGTLAVDGNTTLGNASGDTVTITGPAVTTPNGLNFDSNTLVVDAANDRVGVNNASPSVALDVTGAVTASGVVTANGGVAATNASGAALTVTGDTTSPVAAAFRLIPQDAEPTGPSVVGDMYVTTAGKLMICTVAGTPGTFTIVGTQS